VLGFPLPDSTYIIYKLTGFAMPIYKEEIEALFSMGEVIPCGTSDENALRVSAILDDRIQLLPALSGAREISLEYRVIAGALDAHNGDAAEPYQSPMRCFIAEYLNRADQARREEQVDALWSSAGVLWLNAGVC